MSNKKIVRLFTYRNESIGAIIQSYYTSYPETKQYQFIGFDKDNRYVFTDSELSKVKKQYKSFIHGNRPTQLQFMEVI